MQPGEHVFELLVTLKYDARDGEPLLKDRVFFGLIILLCYVGLTE